MNELVEAGYGVYVSGKEFQTIVNEKLIDMGLPEKELIDETMADKYIDFHYTVDMAIDDVFYAYHATL